MPIDVGRIGCDFLSATARKFLRGPRGMGFLYVSDRALESGLEPLFLDLRGADWVAPDLYQPAPDARRFENWEFSYALLLGTGEAARYALDTGIAAIQERIRFLAGRLRSGLGALPGAQVLDRGPELCGIVTVAVDGWRAPDLVTALRARGINTSHVDAGSAVIDFAEKGVEGALRVSPHAYNTEDEVDALVHAVAELGRAGGP
jgi:selenocysteine lyase/cysteine desulfurase